MAVSAGHRIFGTPHLPPLGVPGLRKKVCSMRDHRHKNHVQPSQMIEYSSPIEFLLIDANDFKLFSELRLHCLSTNPRRALPTIGIWDPTWGYCAHRPQQCQGSQVELASGGVRCHVWYPEIDLSPNRWILLSSNRFHVHWMFQEAVDQSFHVNVGSTMNSTRKKINFLACDLWSLGFWVQHGCQKFGERYRGGGGPPWQKLIVKFHVLLINKMWGQNFVDQQNSRSGRHFVDQNFVVSPIGRFLLISKMLNNIFIDQ